MAHFNRRFDDQQIEHLDYTGNQPQPRRRRNYHRRIADQNLMNDTLNLFPELRERERLFLSEYIKDYNGTEACKRLGYSHGCSHVVASRILKQDDVREALVKYEKDLASRYIHTKDRVIKEMSIIAFSDIADYFTEEGELRVRNLKELPTHVTRAIKKIKMFKKSRVLAKDGIEGRKGDEIGDIRIEFELYDKIASLVRVGQEIGIFKDKKELTGPDGQPLVPAGPNTIIFEFKDE